MYFSEIPAATFQMGEVGSSVHSVTISKAFYMGKHEVTQAQYKEIMGTNPSYFTPENSYADTASQPVEKVSWYDAVEFCNKLSVQQGLTPVYTIDKNTTDPNNLSSKDDLKCLVTPNWSVNGYRLPTEAEWEYAFRGSSTNTTSYYWGSDSSEVTVKQYAWYSLNAYDREWTDPHAEKGGTQPVGKKTANAFGLCDMSGNVWEWCCDWYEEYPATAQTDPVGPSEGSYRVLRGGGWGRSAACVAVAFRENCSPYFQSAGIGFRIVRP